MAKHYNVLFLCTGNSARSIMAEGILNGKNDPHFTAYSAGSFPSGRVRPETLKQLQLAKLPTAGARSKSWEEFATADALPLHFVFTVCDRAAQEMCPIWPGQPMTAHWGVADPAAVEGTDQEKERAFNLAFRELAARIGIFASLRIDALDELALKRELDAIGKMQGTTAKTS